MNKIIPSVIEDNGEYYIHIEEYKTLKQLVEHYEHLYSEVKKQKDDVVEFLKEYHNFENRFKWCEEDYIKTINEIERMLGEKDEI